MDAYTGRPGHGKSYSVVEYVIIPSLKQNRHVITNIPLFTDDLIPVYGGEITQLPLSWADDPDWASTIPNGVVLVLDEVWRRFPSGQKVTAAIPEDLALFKEHRHRVDSEGNSMRIVLVTQDASDLSSWVRKLVDHTFVMNKLSDVGAKNRFRVDIYQGCPTGERIPKKHLIRSTYGSYKPEIYRYYSSATQSETGMVGDETAADGRTNIWRSTYLWITLGGGLLAGIFGIYFLQSFFNSGSTYAQSEMLSPEQQAAIASQQNINQLQRRSVRDARTVPESIRDKVVPDKQPGLSAMWRVVGHIGRSDDLGADVGLPADPFPDYPNDSIGSTFKALEREPLVILRGLYGASRYIPVSECSQYPDGVHWHCNVDGELVTPWSGQPTFNSAMGGGSQMVLQGTQSAVPSQLPSRATERAGNSGI